MSAREARISLLTLTPGKGVALTPEFTFAPVTKVGRLDIVNSKQVVFAKCALEDGLEGYEQKKQVRMGIGIRSTCGEAREFRPLQTSYRPSTHVKACAIR